MTFLEYKYTYKGIKYSLFKCHCGREFVTREYQALKGITKSCGCTKKPKSKESEHKDYKMWKRIYRMAFNKKIKLQFDSKEFLLWLDKNWKGGYLKFKDRTGTLQSIYETPCRGLTFTVDGKTYKSVREYSKEHNIQLNVAYKVYRRAKLREQIGSTMNDN